MDAPPAKTADQGKEVVTKLCRYFATNRQAFLAPGVKEAHIRQSLIDPLFEALGWDVGNKSMTAPQYREVIPEDSLEVEGQQKAPDYTFRVGSLPKFYAEAKKCGVNIGADPAPAFQLRRYGWSAKLALSILTDFEELAIYDCTMRPRPSEKASHARIQYFHFEEYPDRWRELWDVFSRDAVWSGAFDQYAASKRKRGTSEVDEEFLKEMEGWRLALAGNIALRNKNLSLDDLNAAVQLTIDRVVFLRMAEDRGLEPYEQLLKLCERPDIYSRFMHDLSRRADQKYNSGLFHFQKESGISEEPDRITPKLAVDDKIFKPILQSLYFSHGSPYQFGVMPVEILGTVYERFLGKVIRLTAGHQAKIEEKPEVRKAGGVYYTPAYIVDYIVRQTIARQLEGRSPAQLVGNADKSPFRVLDMACGSGSFLLGAYRCVLDYCLHWYAEHRPENFKKAVYKDSRNSHWRLTIEERKRILTTHIFGVDIDQQAVEVTKLSLLLKVLEGETDQSLSLSQLAFGDRALPNLAENIKCGNSLIGSDYFTRKLFADPEEMKRVNAFDWNQGFPDAMKAGGFDAVIGNPPYGAYLYENDKDYLAGHYPNQTYQLDSYLLFLEKAIRDVLKEGAFYGMIIPNPWLTNLLQDSIRRFVTETTRVREIVHFKFAVFSKVVVDTEIVLLQKAKPSRWEATVTVADTLNAFTSGKPCKELQVLRHQQQKWRDLNGGVINIFTSESEEALAAKCRKISRRLESYCDINVGIKPYQVGKGMPPQTRRTVEERPFDSNRRATLQHRRYLRGTDIGRYKISPAEVRFLRYGPWLAEPRPAANFDAPAKIFMRQTGDSLIAALDTAQLLCLNNMHVLVPRAETPSLSYLLGVINSRLMNWCYHTLNPEVGEALAEVKKTNVAQLPVRPINLSDRAEKAQYDRMATLVDSMLQLNKQLSTVKSAAQKGILQRQIEATDQHIDQLVYQLYGLTDDEVALVEGGESEQSVDRWAAPRKQE
ncbi:MAG: TaqI-like C-terminal specificity domain-containing protein [Candidatus Acidiferrum sp.]